MPSLVANDLLAQTDSFRLAAYSRLDPSKRSEMGQFLTPPPVARLMASMFRSRPAHVSLVDAGAGVGSLTAAFVAASCKWRRKPESISVSAYEVDDVLVGYLSETFMLCQKKCQRAGIRFSGEIIQDDFILAATDLLTPGSLFASTQQRFNAAILNPPYRKINSASEARRLLRTVGIETSNLYTAFVWLVEKLLEPDGEMVAITPRSFCNGPYFHPFRTALYADMTFRRIHVYESRKKAFADDDVLQENVILSAVKQNSHAGKVTITSSSGPDDKGLTKRVIPHGHVVKPDDDDVVIHIVPNDIGKVVTKRMRELSASLSDLKMNVSTGRVVDFRARSLIRQRPNLNTAPLIYPGHFSAGYVAWPNDTIRKPNALALEPGAHELLVPSGYYVLVKRFTAKEEKRRVVAAVFDPERVPDERIGFENHLNYYHRMGEGLLPDLARGLAAFLNSSYLDAYFRQFSGHTQVNAADLRAIRYPSEAQLVALGRRIGDAFPEQNTLDTLIAEELNIMTTETGQVDPVAAQRRIEEALSILRSLGVPRGQQNERSALTLLALIDLPSSSAWSEASDPLIGITQMMDWMRKHYGRNYAPNTRETIRRQTMHQFVQLGLAVENPDESGRPINSPKWCYQVSAPALRLLQSFGAENWSTNLTGFLATASQLTQLQSRHRDMTMLSVHLPDGREITLSGGGHNQLIKAIIAEFCPRYTPGGVVLYLGDAGAKLKQEEIALFGQLGVKLDEHGKMPDVVIHLPEKKWLLLVEAVTSHGPVDIKRHNELKTLFAGSNAGLIFVTTFPDRKTMKKFLGEIAWETEVWVAEAPDHLIHFNGERFLGPYEQQSKL